MSTSSCCEYVATKGDGARRRNVATHLVLRIIRRDAPIFFDKAITSHLDWVADERLRPLRRWLLVEALGGAVPIVKRNRLRLELNVARELERHGVHADATVTEAQAAILARFERLPVCLIHVVGLAFRRNHDACAHTAGGVVRRRRFR